MIYTTVEKTLAYAFANKIIGKEDIIWARNRLYEFLKLPSCKEIQTYTGALPENPAAILADISLYAAENGLIPENTPTYKEIFETGFIASLMRRPSDISSDFYAAWRNRGIKKATDSFYEYCQKVYYIKTDRVARNIKWKAKTDFGMLDMTINLSKPEKDPKKIALQGKISALENEYPKCPLCIENQGYAGCFNRPARQNLRLIPLKLGGKRWFFQYSPYVYYNEHSIVLSEEHKPMKTSRETFKNLLDFVEQFPHYFIGANADLPIVGGSILSHDHYQAGRYVFPMDKAASVRTFKLKKFPGVDFDIIKWPLSVIRVRGSKAGVLKGAAHIFNIWSKYDDNSADILHASNGERHNTVTPIARFKNGKYEMDIALRNNRTSKEYPWGIFHSREEYHNIKRENIGLIEVLGMAILPGRLKNEMSQIADIINGGNIEKIKNSPALAQHYSWVKGFINKYQNYRPQDIMDILLGEIGLTFSKVLFNCGVFKHDEAGRAAFLRFISKL